LTLLAVFTASDGFDLLVGIGKQVMTCMSGNLVCAEGEDKLGAEW
jgi:hypothetical protein